MWKRLAPGLVALAMIVGACGGPTGTDAPPSSGSAAPGGSAAAISGTVTLWHFEDPEAAFLPAAKAEFEAKYPGVTLELTEVPEDEYVTKIDTALLADQPPDISWVYEVRWVKAGNFLPLNDVIAATGIDTSTLNQTAFSFCNRDGTTWCMGSLAGTVMLIYNRDIFEDAGVALPSTSTPMTIDEFAALARSLAKPSDDPATNVWGTTADPPFWWTSQKTTVSEDARQIEGFVNDDATAHMYDVLAGLTRDGTAPTPGESETTTVSDMLGAGAVAMGIGDTEFAASILEQAGFAWGAAPPPTELAGDTPYVFSGTDSYGVFTQAANPEAAKAFIAFVATDGSRIRAEVTDDPPLDTAYLDEWVGDNPGRQQVAEVMELAKQPWMNVPGFWDVTAPLPELFAAMANGEGTAKELLDAEAPLMQEDLDEAWETWDAIE